MMALKYVINWDWIIHLYASLLIFNIGQNNYHPIIFNERVSNFECIYSMKTRICKINSVSIFSTFANDFKLKNTLAKWKEIIKYLT
jgi:hypothetical protein